MGGPSPSSPPSSAEFLEALQKSFLFKLIGAKGAKENSIASGKAPRTVGRGGHRKRDIDVMYGNVVYLSPLQVPLNSHLQAFRGPMARAT